MTSLLLMSATRKGETEKQRRERFEAHYNTIPRDQPALMQRKQDIADALGIKRLRNAKDVPKIKVILKRLDDPDTRVITRDPRVTWFTLHQVWKNCDVIRKHAKTILEELYPLDSGGTLDDESAAVPEATSTVDENVGIFDVDRFAEDADASAAVPEATSTVDAKARIFEVDPFDMESVFPDVAPAVPATSNWGLNAEVMAFPIDNNASSSDLDCALFPSGPLADDNLDELFPDTVGGEPIFNLDQDFDTCYISELNLV